MNEQQRSILIRLNALLVEATDAELFDGNISDAPPDIINGFCDWVDHMLTL